MDYALGIDVGATNVKTAALTPTGEPLQQSSFETRDGESPTWPDTLKQHVKELEIKLGAAKWLGVACPGLAAHDGRSIAWMQGRMAAVQGFDWTNHFGRGKLVPVLNDAHAALIGEVWLGAGRGAKNAVLLTLGTGVGGAILSEGRLLKGAIGRAGHLGHISLDPDGPRDIVGTPGSLEDAIGEHTLLRRSSGRFSSTSQLLAAISQHDDEAQQIWLKSVKALAAGITSIINCVDPEVVILAGGIAKAGDAMLNPLNEFLGSFERQPLRGRVRIALAELGEFAGAIGAARNAMQA